MMKTYIVKWWDGEECVKALNETEAKQIVSRTSVAYRYRWRGAPFFVEEFNADV